MISKRSPYRPWTDEQSSLAVCLYYGGATMKEIGRKVGHTKGSVWSHLRVIDFGREPHRRRNQYIRLRPSVGERPPPEVMSDRDVRLAIEPRSIGAAIFGDPLPGRSALDRRARA